MLVARADDRREPVGRGDDHDDVAPQECRGKEEYMGGEVAWSEQILSQEENQQARDKEEGEEAKFDDEAPECQFAGLAPVARDIGEDDSRYGEHKHRGEPDVDPEHRVGRIKHHGKRPARIGCRDKAERGDEGCDSRHGFSPSGFVDLWRV